MSPAARGLADPLRELARERGRMLGELGVRPDDVAWARAEGDAIASLVTPRLALRLPVSVARLVRRWTRAIR